MLPSTVFALLLNRRYKKKPQDKKATTVGAVMAAISGAGCFSSPVCSNFNQ